MPTKNLYYSDEDAPLVEAAIEVAGLHRTNFSRLVLDALEVHVPKVAAEPPPPSADKWAEIAANARAAA